MQAGLPPQWEELLWDAVRVEAGVDATELAALTGAILDRTRRYTDERHRLGERLSGRAGARDLAARALFFTVADAPKIAIPLAELSARGLIGRSSLRVLDVGAGAGAMSLGLLAALPGVQLQLTAVDRDRAALGVLQRVIGAVAPSARVEVVLGDVTAALPQGPYDLVVAGTLLNELSADAHLPLARALLERLAPQGTLILVEPALRDTARALHALRDALVDGGLAHVFAPCTHQRPCPALLDARDWCHEDRRWTPPPRIAGLMRRTGLRDEGLKFAYLSLRREPDPLVVPPPTHRALRVVSGALDHKGVVERIVCGEAGRRHVRVLRRRRDDSLSALASSRRGDVLIEDGLGELRAQCSVDEPDSGS
jgi:precorrin-6B methylase 2